MTSAKLAVSRRAARSLAGVAATLLLTILVACLSFGEACYAADPASDTVAKPALTLKDTTLKVAPLTIEVTGVRSAQGVVRVAVCTARTFLKDGCPYVGSSPATVGATVVTVPDLPPGVYAVQLFHDENDNDRVDRGLFGVPTEAVGFSNDAAVGLKGPSFTKASFNHGGERQTLTVALRRFSPSVP